MDKFKLISSISSARNVKKVDLSEFATEGLDDLYIRKLSAAERSTLIEMWKVETGMEPIYRFTLPAALTDAEGRKIFDDPEADGKAIVNEWPCDLVDGLTNQILKFSGIIKEDAEQAEKN